MGEKDAIIAMRNTIFIAGEGMSLESFMLGSIMAQTQMVIEAAESPEQASEILSYFFNVALESVPVYWKERARRQSSEGER